MLVSAPGRPFLPNCNPIESCLILIFLFLQIDNMKFMFYSLIYCCRIFIWKLKLKVLRRNLNREMRCYRKPRKYEKMFIVTSNFLPNCELMYIEERSLLICKFSIFVRCCFIKIWTTPWENLFMPYANNKGTDQPGHPRSLISTLLFAA